MTTFRVVNLSMQIWGSVMSLIIIACMYVPKRMKRRSDRLYVGMLGFHIGHMLMDALALYFRGKTGIWNTIGVYGANFLSFFCGNVLTILFVWFQHAYLERRLGRKLDRTVVRISQGLLVLQTVLLVLNLFVPIFYRIDEHNVYSRMPGYALHYVPGFICLVLALFQLWRYRTQLERWESFSFLLFIFMPAVTWLVTLFHYGIAFGYMGNSMSLVIMYVYLQAEYGRRAAERENELTQMKVAVMMSQIRPHFLFNALNSIEYLCNIGSEEAGKALNHFAVYLRRNMDSIAQQTPTTFEEELNHLENYLYIERIRFPQIRVYYELQTRNFQLPALTLQPLVENAIKHGLAGRLEDGWVRIETSEDERAYYLKVTDNGCGFKPGEQRKDGRSHVGLENTKTRLQMMCKGDMIVQSEPGKGTCVQVILPK